MSRIVIGTGQYRNYWQCFFCRYSTNSCSYQPSSYWTADDGEVTVPPVSGHANCQDCGRPRWTRSAPPAPSGANTMQDFGLAFVSDALPRDLLRLITDYLGCIRFWQHCFRACLQDIRDLQRPDDTYYSYRLRTGISYSGVPADPVEGYGPAELDLVRNDDDRARDNVVYIALEWYFSDYEYGYDEFSHVGVIPRLIYQYLGWFYGFQWPGGREAKTSSTTENFIECE